MKTIILGLDGTSSSYLKELIDSGALPTFKMISEQGCFGNLKSTIPVDSSTGWSSAYTGMTPGKTGMYGHLKKRKADYDWDFVTASDLKSKPVWTLASGKGKKCFLFLMPETYPPSEVNGIFVSKGIGMSSEDAVLPKEFENKLFKEYGFEMKKSSDLRNFDEFKGIIEKKFDIAEKVLSENEFDLIMLGFIETDVANHLFYFERKDEQAELYKIIDRRLKRLLDETPQPFNLIIHSDHGFKGYRHVFHLGSWMVKNNLVQLKKGRKKAAVINEKKRLEKEKLLAKHKTFLGKMLASFVYELIFFAKNRIPFFRRIRKFIPIVLPPRLTIHEERFPESLTDFEETRFYAYPQAHGNFAGVYVNLKGREATGVVEPKDFEKARNEFIEKISSVEFSVLGIKAVKKAWKKEELFKGDLTDFPDIVVEADGAVFPSVLELNMDPSNIFRPEVVTPQHEINGVVLAYGTGIKKGVRLNHEIQDIAPTVLASLGIKIPRSFEGKVLPVFSDEFLKENPARFCDENTAVDSPRELSSRQKKDIREELKGLGYI